LAGAPTAITRKEERPMRDRKEEVMEGRTAQGDRRGRVEAD
jgi:hypothetical protein